MGYEMRARLLQLMGVGATITVVSLIMATVGCQAQTTTGKAGAAAKTSPAPKTPWGEPDLQGLWTIERIVPLQLPPGLQGSFTRKRKPPPWMRSGARSRSLVMLFAKSGGAKPMLAVRTMRSSLRRGLRAGVRR